MDMIRELRKRAQQYIEEARSILDEAEKEDRDLTDEEQESYDAAIGDAEKLQARAKRLEEQEKRELELEAKEERKAQGAQEEEKEERAEIKVGRDRDREKRFAYNTLRMFRGIMTRQGDEVRHAQLELAKEGHYGEEGQKRAAGDYYSTLVDADGAVLLPTQVVREIEEISEIYGVAQQLCTTFNHIVGTLKVPGATGDLAASAVGEGGAISSSMRQFQAVSLNPKKWALIVPWTYEANLEVGPQILADANRAIARGFAKAQDDSLFNGDGTTTYNSIDGILSSNRTSVASYTLGAGDTSFDDFAADDVFLLRRQIAPSVRSDAVYVFHPDMEPHLRTLKDGDGAYLYAFNSDTGVATLGGRPVFYTEVLPDIGDDAADTAFGVYGAFSYFKMALGQGMSSEELREGTVKDADTGSDINLATQDMRALKVRAFWDMDANFEEAFCKIVTSDS